jgi:hypothetical protein
MSKTRPWNARQQYVGVGFLLAVALAACRGSNVTPTLGPGGSGSVNTAAIAPTGDPGLARLPAAKQSLHVANVLGYRLASGARVWAITKT